MSEGSTLYNAPAWNHFDYRCSCQINHLKLAFLQAGRKAGSQNFINIFLCCDFIFIRFPKVQIYSYEGVTEK
jgi:hypothetical protein